MTLATRIARLEAVYGAGGGINGYLDRLIDDELQMLELDVSRQIVGEGVDDTAGLADAAASVARIEGGIRAQAAMRRKPGYDEHLDYVRRGREDFVPAICGDFNGNANSMMEYSDLDKPDVMARRRAILARPDVQALIGAEAERVD